MSSHEVNCALSAVIGHVLIAVSVVVLHTNLARLRNTLQCTTSPWEVHRGLSFGNGTLVTINVVRRRNWSRNLKNPHKVVDLSTLVLLSPVCTLAALKDRDRERDCATTLEVSIAIHQIRGGLLTLNSDLICDSYLLVSTVQHTNEYRVVL